MPTKGPELRDIHVPYVSHWWPLAPGWWGLLALLFIAIVVIVVLLRRRAAWRRHVEATLADVRAAQARHAKDGDATAFAAAASQLLRRVARERDARSVSLKGSAWHDALAAMAPGRDMARLVMLDDAIYRRTAAIDAAATVTDIEAWVRDVLPRSGRRPHVAT
jgi:type VI protein secretion system component VasK